MNETQAIKHVSTIISGKSNSSAKTNAILNMALYFAKTVCNQNSIPLVPKCETASRVEAKPKSAVVAATCGLCDKAVMIKFLPENKRWCTRFGVEVAVNDSINEACKRKK